MYECIIHFREVVGTDDIDLVVIWVPEIFEAGWDFQWRLFRVGTNIEGANGETLERKLRSSQ